MKRLLDSIKTIRSNQQGLTLLEAVIGMAIFTIGILAIAHLQNVSTHNNSLAQTATVNSHHAMQTIESLFAMGWNSPDAQPTPPIKEFRDGGLYEVEWGINEYPTAGVVAMADELSQPTVRLITVTSTYTDEGGTRRSVTLRLLKPRM